MKSTLAMVIVTFVVALGIWTAFSLTSYPLDEGGTVVVVGVVGLVVFGTRAMIASARRKRATEPPSKPADQGGTHG
jgi:hypothetical protein